MQQLSRLRAIREDKALSMRALSLQSGVSVNTIFRAEKGESAYPATVTKLAKALGVTPAELRGPEPVTQGYAAPERPRTAPSLVYALAEAERLRRADDLAGAATWEQIAAGMAARAAASTATDVD